MILNAHFREPVNVCFNSSDSSYQGNLCPYLIKGAEDEDSQVR